MKDFHRGQPWFSQCGLNCLLCPMNLGGYCPGCGGGEGNQSCAIARCAMEQGVEEFCSRCGQFPCERYGKMMRYDSFIPHSRMVQDLELAEELGLEVYITQLEERRSILDRLLASYNDGRRKGFYILAVYLLELDSLRRAYGKIQETVSEGAFIKERSMIAVEILKKAAEADGVTLKLKKKPKEQ